MNEMTFADAQKICKDFGIASTPFDTIRNAKAILAHQENLAINAALLARQTDLARVAESDLHLETAYHEATKRSLFSSNSMILDLEKKVAPLLDVCKWLLFHAENGRRWKTVAHRGLDFTEDEFEGRLRAAIQKAEGE
jgi:hypothetical protein